jgi:hypothetical protein
MQTGVIHPATNTFDIAGVNETETSILLTPTQLQLSYRDEQGRLIRFVKTVPATYYKKALATDPRNVNIGTKLVATADGRLAPGERNPTVAKSLVDLDWNDLSNYQNTTVNGRTAALIPVAL